MKFAKSAVHFVSTVTLILAGATSATFFSAPAHASLLGQTIGCDIRTGLGPNLADPKNPVVSNDGIECSYTGPSIATVDLSEVAGDSFVEVNFALAGTTTFVDLTNLFWADDPTGIITGLDLIDTNLPGPTGANASFEDHRIKINWLDFDAPLGYYGKWAIETSHVPLPAPMALIGLGLLGVYMTRRRQSGR